MMAAPIKARNSRLFTGSNGRKVAVTDERPGRQINWQRISLVNTNEPGWLVKLENVSCDGARAKAYYKSNL